MAGNESRTDHASSISSVMVNTDLNQNPINKYFTVKKHVASAGPELLWKIYDAIRLEDSKVCSVFLFEKRIADKLHKPRRREIVTAVLRREVAALQNLRNPRVLQVVHPIEENK
ncbi:hypothetical protein Ciccas_008221 [Cichlidogyrus casuarinus]|uniref:SCY1-like protein 2 n=1 Tax=Cichlidogyrus casuarinus TaxID=1844966 RepID=A0ABD2Q134_9PLAT